MTTVVAAVPDDDPYADRRAYPRVPVALPAFLHANGERHSVQIVDLSSGGAKLDCAARLASGAAVVLDCGLLRCAAVVRWQNDRGTGISFDRELEPRDASALIARSNALANRMNASG